MSLGPSVLGAALATAVVAGIVVAAIVPAPRRLHSRVAPYTSPRGASAKGAQTGVIAAVFGPIVRDLADRLGRVVDRSGESASLVKLRQAGWFPGLDESDLLARYRARQLKSTAVSVVVGLAVARVIGARPVVAGVLVALAAVVGVTRTRGQLDKAIERRREAMKIEVYTVNQLLAMRVRAGGGVINAVKAITQRGRGEVVSELEEALRLHRAGWPGPAAFRRIAELTPEPFCARTYRLLAAAEERGADLAPALLSLSEDVRESRRESIRRTATKRRAAMLVPTIAILAPVLILFVAAPLPYLVTSWR
jgi:Flp pilus assembly protein TadB